MTMEQLDLFETCGRCGAEFMGAAEYCPACLEEAAGRYKSEKTRRRWLAGMCVGCGRPARPGRVTCGVCAERLRARGARRGRERRDHRVVLEAARQYFHHCPLCGSSWPLHVHHAIRPAKKLLPNVYMAGSAIQGLWGRTRMRGSLESRAARLRELETLIGLCGRCHQLVHDLGWNSEFPSFHAIDLAGYDAVYHEPEAEGVLYLRTGTDDWDLISYVELRRHFWGQVERHIPGYKPPFYGPCPGLLHPGVRKI